MFLCFECLQQRTQVRACVKGSSWCRSTEGREAPLANRRLSLLSLGQAGRDPYFIQAPSLIHNVESAHWLFLPQGTEENGLPQAASAPGVFRKLRLPAHSSGSLFFFFHDVFVLSDSFPASIMKKQCQQWAVCNTSLFYFQSFYYLTCPCGEVNWYPIGEEAGGPRELRKLGVRICLGWTI